ncbi:MAG TPA: benzoate transporter, partial [Phycisphaerae bacterium]|nr:benzoate transporter [Phycisphaerae bacterium]
GEGWVSFINGGESFGLLRDGAWHEVSIPMSRFGNVDFNTLVQLFMLAGDAPPTAFNFSIDNMYWSPSVPRPTPENGSFGIFTETAAHKTAGEYQLGVNGEFYIWENTLLAGTEHPYEGGGCMSLGSAPGGTWFGAAFTPEIKYDLTGFRYPQSKLHVALKTSSTTTFSIGMKSGTVNDIGQQWIRFENGNDPYGFVRDGQWHVVEIPMSDFANGVDLSQVSQLFELLGVDGPISNIEIDDICLLGGGAAIGGTSSVPGDIDADGDVDLNDAALFVQCLSGPGNATAPVACAAQEFADSDLDADGDVDLNDYSVLAEILGQ